MKIFPIFALASLLLSSCTSAEQPEAAAKEAATAKPIHLDAPLAKAVISTEKPVLLDVRTPGEFDSGTIKGSKNIDFNSPDFEKEIAKLDQSKTYLVYCRSGNRSGQALQKLKTLKLAKLYHLDGGIKAWQAAGNPVE